MWVAPEPQWLAPRIDHGASAKSTESLRLGGARLGPRPLVLVRFLGIVGGVLADYHAESLDLGLQHLLAHQGVAEIDQGLGAFIRVRHPPAAVVPDVGELGP